MSENFAQSGSSTSKASAQSRVDRLSVVAFLVARSGVEGQTWRDVATALSAHHGVASAALSHLHKLGHIARLSETRLRCHVYVHPDFVDGRQTEPYGGRPKVVSDALAQQRQIENLLAQRQDVVRVAWRGQGDPTEGPYGRHPTEIVQDLRDDYDHLQRQVLTPPPGWSVFGTHISPNDTTTLEFWGDDGTGMPLWERPKAMPTYIKHEGEWRRVDDLPLDVLAALYPHSGAMRETLARLQSEVAKLQQSRDEWRKRFEGATERYDQYVSAIDESIESVAMQLTYLDNGGALAREIASNIRSILDI